MSDSLSRLRVGWGGVQSQASVRDKDCGKPFSAYESVLAREAGDVLHLRRC